MSGTLLLPAQSTVTVPVPQVETALRAPRKPRVWTSFTALLLALTLAEIGGGIFIFVVLPLAFRAVASIQGVEPAADPMEPVFALLGTLPGALLSLGVFQLSFLAVTLGAARLSPTSMKRRLGFVIPALPKGGRTALLFAPLATVSMANLVFVAVSLLMPPPESSPLQLDAPSFADSLVLSIIVAIVPAFVEEMFFRGYLQRRLLQRWSPKVAIGISSLLFSLIHYDSWHHVVAVMPLAVLLGVVAYRSGSIWPCVALHMLHNAYVGALGMFSLYAVNQLSEVVIGVILLTLLTGALFGFAAALYLMLRRVEGTPLDLADEQPLTSAEEVVDYEEILAEDLAPVPAFEPMGLSQPLVAQNPLREQPVDPLTTLSA
jgi:membrane protease YdiL (CAAX protease family)